MMVGHVTVALRPPHSPGGGRTEPSPHTQPGRNDRHHAVLVDAAVIAPQKLLLDKSRWFITIGSFVKSGVPVNKLQLSPSQWRVGGRLETDRGPPKRLVERCNCLSVEGRLSRSRGALERLVPPTFTYSTLSGKELKFMVPDIVRNVQ